MLHKTLISYSFFFTFDTFCGSKANTSIVNEAIEIQFRMSMANQTLTRINTSIIDIGDHLLSTENIYLIIIV